MPDRREILKGLATVPATGLAAARLKADTTMASTPASTNTMPTWADQMKALMPVGDNLIAKWGRPNVTEVERQDMYTLALSMLAGGYLCHVYLDPARPVWTPLWNLALNQGGPNPDFVYSRTQVDPTGNYRISGYRGTSRFIDFTQQISRIITSMAAMKPSPAVNDLDELSIGKDGYFSVLLSAERPADYKGDWWQLHPETQVILMRRCACDWQHELDARVAIERLDEAAPSSPVEIAKRFSEMPEWVEGMISFDMELVKYYRAHHPTNGLERSKVVSTIGGLLNQFYYDGIYEIEDDEALVVETELPKQCRYWQMLVADDRFCTVDWYNRQSSLNDLQARLDTDGKLRTVISRRDPGVPNWLDKADNKWGIIQMRLNKASDSPQPVVTRCKLSDVRRHLPAETPVVSPEERSEALRKRREAVQMRILW